MEHVHSLPPTLLRAAIHWNDRASFVGTCAIFFASHHRRFSGDFSKRRTCPTPVSDHRFPLEKTIKFDIMSEFEPIPEEIPRQSASRSAQKDGGSSDRKSKSSDKHAGREKKVRSSKNRSSKGESPSSGQAGQGHGRSGSNSSSKSSSKHRNEPLISLTSTVDVDMAIAENDNLHGIVPVAFPYFLFVAYVIDSSPCYGLAVRMENVTMLNSLSVPAIILLLLQCLYSRSLFHSSAFFIKSCRLLLYFNI